MGEDVPMQDQISANASNESSITHISESTVLTRLKQKKKAVKSQPGGPVAAEDQETPALQRFKLIPQKKRKGQKKATTQNDDLRRNY